MDLAQAADAEVLRGLGVRQLKARLTKLDVDFSKVNEKQEMVKLLVAATNSALA